MFATANRKPQPAGRTAHDEHRERSRRREARLSREGRDISPLPKVANEKRKKKGARAFIAFLRSYFPDLFYLPFSPDHLRVIAKIEQAVLKGGLFAIAMPRGNGKTTLCELACLWAILYGHRAFVALIGSDEESALEMLDSLKSEMEHNDLLLDDFPEVCYPVRRIDGIAQRCKAQLFEGSRTAIQWKGKEIVLPTIPGSKASGAVVRVAGLTGRIRGMKFKRPDGQASRPDLVVIDDPQTDESARSPSQCATREKILAGAVLGLAGPGKNIAGVMPCTVIARGDMADNILKPELHPEWKGERCKMVYAWPINTKLWEQYAQLWREDMKGERDDLPTATAFYRKNRKAMDEGARVAWEERRDGGELSAIQFAYNLRLIRGEWAFLCEYQNDPPAPVEENVETMTAAEIAGKVNGYERRVIPIGAEHLTAFIDVQQSLLYWLVAAWADDFTGWVIDYGTYPDQPLPYFTLTSATVRLADLHAGPLDATIYAGLNELTKRLCATTWTRDDGAPMHIGRCPIDANDGNVSDVVYDFIRQSEHRAVLLPSHGRGIGPKERPMGEYQKRRGDKVGLNWRIPGMKGTRPVRHLSYDTNAWKSFTLARLSAPLASKGCLSLFKASPAEHQMLADHAKAEYPVEVSARGRKVNEWKQRPGQDNHWWDCLVGSAVAASIQGVALPMSEPAKPPREKRQKLSLAELQRQKARGSR